MKNILYTALLALLAVSCSHTLEYDTTDSEEILVDFSTSGAITKVEGSSTSTEDYLFTLINTSAYADPKYTSSVYSYNPADNSLTRGEGESGLYMNNCKAYLVIASPATEMEEIGNTMEYGHIINRSTDTPLYINDPTIVNIEGISIPTDEYRYIHDLGNVTLKQKRSRVKVRFKSDLAKDPRTVNTLYFKDVYNRAYACAEEGILFTDDYPNTNVAEEFTDFPENPQTYNSATDYSTAKTDDNGFTYFISSDYSAKDAHYPTLVVGIPDGEDTREIDIPLNISMKPMMNYTYEINISSVIFQIKVIESNWFNGGEYEGIINPVAKYTINIATGEIEWEIGGDATTVDPDNGDKIVQTVDFTTKENSNCYILNPDARGTSVYYIPITRILEFWEDETYVDDKYKINGVQEALSDGRWEAVMYWHDYSNTSIYQPINNVKIEKSVLPKTDVPCVKVSIPKEMAQKENHCNIGYVVRKTDNKDVMWSWHLWITDYNPYGEQNISEDKFVYDVEGGELHRYDNDFFNSGIYSDKLIMDRNLGARSADFEGHGSMISNTVTAPGTIYYQFGRKDPFPAYWNLVNGYTLGTKTGQYPFEDCVNYPSTYFAFSGNWCNEGGDVDFIWNDHSIFKTGYNKGKSIFDPSPLSFRLPIDGTWQGFTGGSAVDENTNPNSYTFKLTNNNNGTITGPNDRMYKGFAYFPASGFRTDVSANVNYTGTSGRLWNASVSSPSNLGYNLSFSIPIKTNSGNFTPAVSISSINKRSSAYAVRPIQE